MCVTCYQSPRSGRLSTARQLDRERTRVHRLVVAVVDDARPELSSSVNVSVFVADRNDHSPVVEFPRPDNHSVQAREHTSQPVSGSTNLLTHDQVNKIPRTGYFVAVIMFDFRSLIPRSKQITMGHGSSGSTSLSGSRGSRVSSRDPLTHLVVLTGNCNSRES